MKEVIVIIVVVLGVTPNILKARIMWTSLELSEQFDGLFSKINGRAIDKKAKFPMRLDLSIISRYYLGLVFGLMVPVIVNFTVNSILNTSWVSLFPGSVYDNLVSPYFMIAIIILASIAMVTSEWSYEEIVLLSLLQQSLSERKKAWELTFGADVAAEKSASITSSLVSLAKSLGREFSAAEIDGTHAESRTVRMARKFEEYNRSIYLDNGIGLMFGFIVGVKGLSWLMLSILPVLLLASLLRLKLLRTCEVLLLRSELHYDQLAAFVELKGSMKM